jgi:hypothetical protein
MCWTVDNVCSTSNKRCILYYIHLLCELLRVSQVWWDARADGSAGVWQQHSVSLYRQIVRWILYIFDIVPTIYFLMDEGRWWANLKLNYLERRISLFHCFIGSFDECEQLMSVLRSIEIAIQFRIYIEKKLIPSYFIWNWDEILKTEDPVVVIHAP